MKEQAQPGKPTRNHVLFIIALMLVVGVLHYGQYFGLPWIHTFTSSLGLSRHTADRILLLIPIIWSGYNLGFGAGLATASMALVIMVPRAIFISEMQVEALIESVGVVLTGFLACLWLETERHQRRAAVRLEMVQSDLQSNVRLLRSHQKRLSVLNAISTMLTHSMEIKQVLEIALDMVVDVMETDIALVFCQDGDPQRFILVARRGISDKFARLADGNEIGQGFNGQVTRTGAPLFIEDVSRDPRFTRAVTDEKIQTVLVVPLKVKDVVTGTLCLAQRSTRRFLPEEMELVSAIGSHLGIAIENARLYQSERFLGARYRSIFENASDAIWVHDSEGRILAANRALTRLTGYTQQDIADIESARIFKPEDLKGLKEIEGRILRNESQGDTREIRAIKKDGAEVIFELTTTVYGSDGISPGIQHIARDVTESRRAQENLRFYTQAVTKAQEEERNRIARELHDETIQQLIAVSHQLEDFTLHTPGLSPAETRLLGALRQRLTDTLEGVRRFSRDLRPPMLDDLGLISSVEWWISQLSGAEMPAVKLKVVGEVRRFAPEAELLLFRIIQEALINVRRHAHATQVEVTVEFAESKTVLIVRDNGKGFELPRLAGDLSRKGKLGLIGMDERARLLGATLSIETQPGRGTTVVIEVPGGK
ncbi:MAG: PAS domain S-box protein [Dehalococcoidia bacterium]|nr:PAS domain S-box protein [Dehalococcoidia bacterium]